MRSDKTSHAKEGAYDDWEEGNLPDGWHFWQHTKMGKFFLDTTTGYGDKYSARAEGIGSGCFLVKCPAAPSADYAVEAYHKGKLAASVRVRWQNQNKWVVPEKDFIFSFDEDAKDGWKKATGFVTVPHDADMMVVLLAATLSRRQRKLRPQRSIRSQDELTPEPTRTSRGERYFVPARPPG